MSERAKKFIEKKLGIVHFSFGGEAVIPRSKVAELLEQFHKECLPTDAEIEKRFPLHSFGGDPDNGHRGMGAYWCRDFVREEPKEVRTCSNCKINGTDLINWHWVWGWSC